MSDVPFFAAFFAAAGLSQALGAFLRGHIMSAQDHAFRRWGFPVVVLLLVGLTLSVCEFSTGQQGNAVLKPQETIPVVLEVFTLPTFQQDLGLSDEQITDIAKVAKQMEGKQKASRDIEAKNALKKILRPEQFKRFEQIMLQGLMVRAFWVPEVVKRLGLSPEQKKKLNAIRNELHVQLQPFQQSINSGGTPKDYAEAISLDRAISPLYTKAFEKALAVLTAEQKKTWAEMRGATVKPVNIKAAQANPHPTPPSADQ